MLINSLDLDTIRARRKCETDRTFPLYAVYFLKDAALFTETNEMRNKQLLLYEF